VTLEVTIEVAQRLGYAGDDGPLAEMFWTDNVLERLNRVPKFERQMVREMVESLARDNGHSAVNYDVADEMLIKVRQMWEAQSEGAFGFFKGMAANDNQAVGNGGSPGHE
jgi:hypothetical protein